MPEPIKFLHSFNSGDLISVLPGVRHICEQTQRKAIIYQRLGLRADYSHNDPHPVVGEDGLHVCMNKQMFDMMRPLLRYQDYIEGFRVWAGEAVDFNFDNTRFDTRMPLPGGTIYKWPSLIFPQLECEINSKWLEVFPFEKNDKIIINRTERYNNPYIDYFFLKQFEDKVWFTGTEKEWLKFSKDFELDIPFLSFNGEPLDFLELARAIAGCKLFIGNQSLCWHIAEAVEAPRILEVCSQFPNTFPILKNGYSFINQGSLEYRFKELLNRKEEGKYEKIV